MLLRMFLLVFGEVTKRYALPAIIAVAVTTGITALSGGTWTTALAISAALAVLLAIVTALNALNNWH